MELLLAVIIGAIAGFIGGKIFKGSGSGLLFNIIIGIIGGFIGGWLFGKLGIHINSWIGVLISSIIGSIILLWIWSLIFGKKK